MEDKNTPNKDRAAFACCDETEYLQTGLTKREYFAGQALIGLLSINRVSSKSMIATRAVEVADALLHELERTERKEAAEKLKKEDEEALSKI